ncbi:GDSL-type esterase/lipase family protein [Longispora albida]|uniref:GDSL-type esterase/lipase family protein n=1 Tax=Longispora albida TaxID=203523 RepID=UPI000362A181|nr:GDSL-type esterase/lipase family protein [Longispora albida]
MDVNPDAIRVLCFGDSNTYGQRAEDVDRGRWPVDVRWTGLLQKLLGDGYSVIEEGLNGRTTDLDEEGGRPGRSGRAYLIPCLESHYPLDVVVLWLGANDCKPQFGRPVAEIVAAVGRLVGDIRAWVAGQEAVEPRIILLGPTDLDESQPDFHEFVPAQYAPEILAKVRQLPAAYRALAAELGVEFADVSTAGRPGADGMHLSLDSHPAVAALVARAVAG